MRLIDADAINPMRCPRSISEMRKWIDEQPTVDIDKVLKQFYTIIEELGDKLEHYETLEEQGRLLELPCAVGDTVHDIAGKEARKQIVDGIEYTADGFFIYANEDEWLGRLGDLVFLTKEEAEAKLKERGEQE